MVGNVDEHCQTGITGFFYRNGSTGVSYTVVYHASDVTDIQHILENDVEKNLNNLTDVDKDYIRNVFQGEKALGKQPLYRSNEARWEGESLNIPTYTASNAHSIIIYLLLFISGL